MLRILVTTSRGAERLVLGLHGLAVVRSRINDIPSRVNANRALGQREVGAHPLVSDARCSTSHFMLINVWGMRKRHEWHNGSMTLSRLGWSSLWIALLTTNLEFSNCEARFAVEVRVVRNGNVKGVWWWWWW